jgi:raffinose/stachyose/melibiose transport system permease protein
MRESSLLENSRVKTYSGQLLRSRSFLKRYSFLWFLVPALLVYSIFVLYPIVNAIILSFFSWDGISPERTFVGLNNYITILTQDSVFWNALRNTALWAIMSLVVPTSLGLTFALALNNPIVGRVALRTIFYIPAVLATVVVGLMWSWMYNPSLGLINAILTALGLEHLIQDWLGNRNIALFLLPLCGKQQVRICSCFLRACSAFHKI